MKNLCLTLVFFLGGGSLLFGNGGAWQTGVPQTGNASASKNDRHTEVTIENEALKIDLHAEYAAVEVRYRMHNTGPKVQQDFFFPVERWGKNPDADTETKSDDIDHYRISVDGKELASTNVARPKEESSSETSSGQIWEQNVSAIKSWKKSVILFERNQTREVTIHYQARYAENDESVSNDSHISDATFAYSLGNLVFDGAPSVTSWNRGALLEVGLNEDAKVSSVSLIPVALEDGLPCVEVTETNRFGSR